MPALGDIDWGDLKPRVTAKIGRGVMCNCVFDSSICIHGNPVKVQCPLCQELLAGVLLGADEDLQ